MGLRGASLYALYFSGNGGGQKLEGANPHCKVICQVYIFLKKDIGVFLENRLH